MSTLDLSYAKEKHPQSERAEVTLSVSARGWGWGWSIFEGDRPTTSGFFRVPDHEGGHATTHAKKCVLAFGELIEAARRAPFQVLITDVREPSHAAASLLPVLAAMNRAMYVQADRDWLDQVDLKKKELSSWATVFLGKAPQDETVSLSLGLGNWWARRRKLERGQLGL